MTEHDTNAGNAGPSPNWDDIARHLTGETSPEESARLDALLARADKDLLAKLDQAIGSLTPQPPADLDVEAALRHVKARRDSSNAPIDLNERRHQMAENKPAKRRFAVPAMAAAGLIVVAGAGWLALEYRNNPVPATNAAPRMLATGVGVRDSLDLPDGSRVVLGPLSSVAVSAAYGEVAREVRVRGDAWFEVAHDDAKPFIVSAGGATITDLGTRFAVRSDTGGAVAVTVTEGSVSLRQANAPVQQGVILKAGDNATLQPGGQVVTRRGAATADDVAWLNGRLVFRESPLDDVVASMRRWYGIELRIDPVLANRHLTATFSGDSPDRVLEVIRLALGAEIERRGDTAVVRPARGSVRSR